MKKISIVVALFSGGNGDGQAAGMKPTFVKFHELLDQEKGGISELDVQRLLQDGAVLELPTPEAMRELYRRAGGTVGGQPAESPEPRAQELLDPTANYVRRPGDDVVVSPATYNPFPLSKGIAPGAAVARPDTDPWLLKPKLRLT